MSKSAKHKPSTPAATSPKKLVGYGAFKGILSSEEFMKEKQEELDREEQRDERRFAAIRKEQQP